MKKGKEVSGGQEDDEGEEDGERGRESKAGEAKLIANAFIPSQDVHSRSSPEGSAGNWCYLV